MQGARYVHWALSIGISQKAEGVTFTALRRGWAGRRKYPDRFFCLNSSTLPNSSPSAHGDFSETMSPKYTTLILDLGDVIFNWSTTTKTTIPPKTLKSIVTSHIWKEYERGRITEDVCYERVGEYFCVSPDELAEAFSQARDSLQSNGAMISFVKDIKAAFDGSLKVYAMSNISKADYAILSMKPFGWSIFDRVFTSSDAGMLKPDLGFYRYILEATDTSPEAAVFVDDKFENVFSARSVGMHGIIFDNTANVVRKLRNLFGEPVQRGKNFLSQRAKRLHSVTESGVTVDDNFAQLLILGATNNQYLTPFLPWGFGPIANLMLPFTLGAWSKLHHLRGHGTFLGVGNQCYTRLSADPPTDTI